jgi:hypothetical protein
LQAQLSTLRSLSTRQAALRLVSSLSEQQRALEARIEALSREEQQSAQESKQLLQRVADLKQEKDRIYHDPTSWVPRRGLVARLSGDKEMSPAATLASHVIAEQVVQLEEGCRPLYRRNYERGRTTSNLKDELLLLKRFGAAARKRLAELERRV